MASHEAVRRIALSLPGVREQTGRMAFSVEVAGKDKGIAWSWLERVHPKKARVPNNEVLAVRVASLEDKEAILSADAEKFFTEPHYNGYPAVLVRLAAVSEAELRKLLSDAWECTAPAELGGRGKSKKSKAAKKPAAKAATRPTAKSATRPAAKSATRPTAKSATRPTAKAATRPTAKSATKPTAKSATRPTAKAATRPTAKSATKPTAKSATRPAAKSATRPAAKSATKPTAKSATKPTAKSATKPAAKSATKKR